MEIYKHENEMSDEEMERRKKFNKRVFPWFTSKIFTTAEEVETWKKYGTGYYLVTTHGGKGNISRCKIICEKTSDDHESERLKITCASSKCNDDSLKCPVQYRLIHCKLLNVWWL